jgi:hypothetical protein
MTVNKMFCTAYLEAYLKPLSPKNVLSRQDYRKALFQEDYRDLRGRIVKQLDRIVSQLENIASELEDEDEEVA